MRVENTLPNPLGIIWSRSSCFLEGFQTHNKCWIQHFELETKRQVMQWKQPSHKEGQGYFNCRESDGLSFEDAKSITNWLSSRGPHHQRAVVCWQNTQEIQREGSCFYRTSLQITVLVFSSCCAWLWLWSGWSFSLFSWFGPIWLPTCKNHLVEN